MPSLTALIEPLKTLTGIRFETAASEGVEILQACASEVSAVERALFSRVCQKTGLKARAKVALTADHTPVDFYHIDPREQSIFNPAKPDTPLSAIDNVASMAEREPARVQSLRENLPLLEKHLGTPDLHLDPSGKVLVMRDPIMQPETYGKVGDALRSLGRDGPNPAAEWTAISRDGRSEFVFFDVKPEKLKASLPASHVDRLTTRTTAPQEWVKAPPTGKSEIS